MVARSAASDTLAGGAVAATKLRAGMERRQGIIAVVAVAAPAIGAVIGVYLLATRGIDRVQLTLLLVGYVLTYGLGMEAGLHRYFSHKSFVASAPLKVLLCIFGSMCFQGPPLFWATVHRRHHAYSDKPGDPHSPVCRDEEQLGAWRGLWHSHIGWMPRCGVTFGEVVRYSRDLLEDPIILRLTSHRMYFAWIALGVLLPGAIAGLVEKSFSAVILGVIWGGLVRIFLAQQVTWLTNSICHMVGWRPFDSRDHSGNLYFLLPVMLGNQLHNNHHAFPGSAVLAQRWWEFDPIGRAILILGGLRLATKVHVPSREAVEAHLLKSSRRSVGATPPSRAP
jgi:stearoyl-CoA desaturase (delta-9 desaturase)